MKSTTETIIGALRVLARDIKTDDGVINACLHEAADRMEWLASKPIGTHNGGDVSNFNCEHCGTAIMDSPSGYVTWCEHYPVQRDNAAAAKAVKGFVNSMIGAFESGFVDSNSLNLAELYRIAQNYIKDKYGEEIQNMRDAWGDDTYKLCSILNNETRHLADGNNCTLIDLKLAVAGKFSQWVKIDYTDPKTWPIEARPCLVAWDSEFKQMASSPAQTWERLAMLVKLDDVEGNDDGECGWLWAECLSGDFEDFDPRPTHWMYAPEFEGALP